MSARGTRGSTTVRSACRNRRKDFTRSDQKKALGLVLSLLPEGADRVAALGAMQTQPAVPKLGKLRAADPLAGKHARQDEVEDRGPVVHAARGNAEDGDECGVRSVEFGVLSLGS